VTDRHKLREAAIRLTHAADVALTGYLGQRVGFAVFVFDFGDGGNVGYASNAQRDGMIAAVREWLARQDAGLESDPLGPRAKT